jgi:hypothetical protein
MPVAIVNRMIEDEKASRPRDTDAREPRRPVEAA